MLATCDRKTTMFVGVDVHKDTHTAVGLSPFGEKLFEFTVRNYEKDFRLLTAKVDAVSKDTMLSPFYGLEDCQSYGERLSAHLVSEGMLVVSVPPVLVDERRKHETHPEKSDALDALGVAKVMIQRIDTLPIFRISETSRKAKQIKELSQDREFLVSERTRLKNQLHTLLHRIWNSEYRTKFKDPFSKKALAYWSTHSLKDSDPFQVRSMKRKVRRLQDIREEVTELEQELKSLLKESGSTLPTASGLGTVVAAEIVGEIGDIDRFHSPAALAKYAGCSPRECSSGKTTRHRKSRSGNRRLNRAFHRMALSQISRSGNDKARTYFAKKVFQGKSKSQALVCLRRQMVNIVWMMMKHGTEYHYE
jgi:transposase